VNLLDSDYLQIGGLKKLIADDIKIETSMEEKGNLCSSLLNKALNFIW